ncbi:hypothetical protein RIB2604_01903190 [Aspergillus luchuensis]|uniref:Uncharacterized protein n=1 Tax=Aspergillus kawachii TaxID=1069201 RepID=A0A146FGL1_ASPKA|nr:hypothetical protein RIB2604_01903190 [Aspergillus luchuensis]
MESEFSGERAMHDADPTDRIIVMNKPDLMMLWLAAELSSELREKEEITLWIPKPRSFLSKFHLRQFIVRCPVFPESGEEASHYAVSPFEPKQDLIHLLPDAYVVLRGA